MTMSIGNTPRFGRRRIAFVIALTIIACVPACRRRTVAEPPNTYPVTGEVVHPAGRPVERVMIQFTPANQEFSSRGIIDAAGKFSLRMLFGDQQLDGAVEGAHDVTFYYPPDVAGDGTIRLDNSLTVKPGENHFKIKLPSAKK